MPQYPAYGQSGASSLVASVTATDDSVQISGTGQNPTLASEGSQRAILSTFGDSLIGNQGAQSVNAANDCVFMLVFAPVADTWKTLEIMTGSTWASTASAFDVGLFDVISGSQLWSYSGAGAASNEGTVLGPTASTTYGVSIAAGAGVAVTAGQMIYVAIYMASGTDGLRGSNANGKGMHGYGLNAATHAPVLGALTGQTKCPASITALGASLVSTYGQSFLVNIRNW